MVPNSVKSLKNYREQTSKMNKKKAVAEVTIAFKITIALFANKLMPTLGTAVAVLDVSIMGQHNWDGLQ